MIKTLFSGALVALVVGTAALLGGGGSASATVDDNSIIPFPPTNLGDNSCEPGIYPITFSGFIHQVIKTQQGVTTTHWNIHLTGYDTKGLEYQLNYQFDFEGLPVAGTPFSFDYVSVNQGPTDNQQRTVVGFYLGAITSVETACRG